MNELVQEVRLAIRSLARERSFTLPVLLTLTVCIAANAAVFAVVDSILLRPLPVPRSERLVFLYNSYPKAGVDEGDDSVPDYYDRRQLPAFADVALYQGAGRTLATRNGSERIFG